MARFSLIKASLHDDKGTWTVRGYYKDPTTGKMRQMSKSTGYKVKNSTKRLANDAMEKIVAEWEKKIKLIPLNHDVSLRYYMEAWLKRKETTTRPNTVKGYRDYASKILPVLGDIPVQDITWRRLQEYYEGLRKTLKVTSVKKYNIVIKGALDDARRDGVIQANPCDLVEWGKQEPYEPRPFSWDEVKQIHAMAWNTPEPMRSAIILGLCYGLRRSEVCGLRWIDIDFEAGTMHIQHTVTQNGQVLLDDDHTKSRKSNRVLALIPSTIPYLKELRSQHINAGLPLDKVVAWPDGHNFRPDGITRMFNTLLKNNGLDPAIRFHDLRHMAASLLANRGNVTPKQIQEFLGHDDISITYDVYVQSSKDSGQQTSNAMGNILDGFIEDTKVSSDFSSELHVI